MENMRFNIPCQFKIGDAVRILKNENIFAKGYTPNWSKTGFVIKKVKNTAPWTYVINGLSEGRNCWNF